MSLLTKFRSWTNDLTGYFIYLLLVATLGPLLFGYHLAELNAPQEVITCAKKSIRLTSTTAVAGGGLPQCIPMDNPQIGLVSSIFTLGGLLGALGAGPISVRSGRLLPMRITTAFFTIGPIAEALAPNIVVLALGRFISGIGAGAALVVVPIYISEIAPPTEKGFFGAFTQIMTNMGIFLTQLLGYFLSHGQMWRVILAIAGVIGFCQFLGLTFAVDSPKWRADQGQIKMAKEELKRIRGGRVDLSEEIAAWKAESAETEEEESETLLSSENANDSNSDAHKPHVRQQRQSPENLSIFQVLTKPQCTRATLAVMGVMVAQQFTGINSIIMYGVRLLSDLLQANSALLNIFVSVLNILVTAACAPLVDTLGRKKCLLMSIAGMGLSSILLATGIQTSQSVLSAISVLLFVASFALGLGPVPFILASELTGPEAVGATQSWALAANWIATFVVAQFFPIVNDVLGRGVVYYLFAGLAFLFLLFVWKFVPETKGKKNLDEIWGRTSEGEDSGSASGSSRRDRRED